MTITTYALTVIYTVERNILLKCLYTDYEMLTRNTGIFLNSVAFLIAAIKKRRCLAIANMTARCAYI